MTASPERNEEAPHLAGLVRFSLRSGALRQIHQLAVGHGVHGVVATGGRAQLGEHGLPAIHQALMLFEPQRHTRFDLLRAIGHLQGPRR